MIHHILLQSIEEVEPLIETDVSSLNLDWQERSYSDYCSVDVTPDTMETTTVLEDTGDGTSWCVLHGGGSNTGDFQIRVQAHTDNTTGSPRSCRIRISDDAGEATDVTIGVTQQFQPA